MFFLQFCIYLISSLHLMYNVWLHRSLTAGICVISSAGWAIHISWSNCCLCVCACVWMLTYWVPHIVTTAHRFVCNLACSDLLVKPDCTTKIRPVWSGVVYGPNCLPKKVDVNRHFKPAENQSRLVQQVSLWICERSYF